MFKDLYNDGLLDTQNINAIMTPDGMLAKRTSDFRDEFFAFITSKF